MLGAARDARRRGQRQQYPHCMLSAGVRHDRAGAAAGAATARLFSPETWRIEALADALASRGMRIVDEFLLNEHNDYDRRLIAAVLGGRTARSGGSGGAPRPAPLRQLARVHEAVSSSAEFGRMRAAISGREPGGGASETELPPLVPV